VMRERGLGAGEFRCRGSEAERGGGSDVWEQYCMVLRCAKSEVHFR
jgi:hypothetical protein